MWESLAARTRLLPAVQVDVVSASTRTEHQPAAAVRSGPAVAAASGGCQILATTMLGA
jgi:hypothetical protein